MTAELALLVSLDLAGTFTYALNGGLTAVRAARLDIVGVVTLAMVSGLGGGIIRDILLGSLPPATFRDWRYLAVAAGGGLAAFALSRQLARLTTVITVLDAAGLGLFAVIGASKALSLGMAAAPDAHGSLQNTGVRPGGTAAGACARHRVPRDLDADRVDQHDAADPRGAQQGDLRGDPAADRVPDHGHVLQAELLDEGVVEPGEQRDAGQSAGPGGAAEAGVNRDQHADVVCSGE